ncbi:MAG: glycosyltransferase family 9 protein [Methylophilaceae bacterium]
MNILRYLDQPWIPKSIRTVRNLSAQTDIQRILIIKWGAMGDVMVSTAALNDIRAAFPHAHITLNTMSAFEHFFKDDPRLNEVFSVDLRGKERGWRGMLRWLQKVRTGRYDLVIDLQSVDRTRMMLGLLQLTGRGIRYRVGNNPGWPYNITPPTLPLDTQGFIRLRATLTAAGIPSNTELPKPYVAESHQQSITALMAEHGLKEGEFAVMLPGCQAAGYLKRWGAERYAALGQKLVASALGGIKKIVIVGGPDEIEDCRAIAELCGDCAVNLCGKTALLDLPPLCASARCIVGNDTGTAQMLTMTGTPMLTLFGPTDPRRAKPIGRHVIALQVDIAYMPCLNCHCKAPCGHQSCMKAITPERAFEEIMAMLHDVNSALDIQPPLH